MRLPTPALLLLLPLLTHSTTLRLTSTCDRDFYFVFTALNPPDPENPTQPPQTSTPVTIVNATQGYERRVQGRGQQLGITNTTEYWAAETGQWVLGLNTVEEEFVVGADGETRTRWRNWWNVNVNRADPLGDVSWNVTTTGLETSGQCGNATQYDAFWMHNCPGGPEQVIDVRLCSENGGGEEGEGEE
ncbi:hypothetical protein MBLNU230_g5274t1 [Neophaeotheca triangularis]